MCLHSLKKLAETLAKSQILNILNKMVFIDLNKEEKTLDNHPKIDQEKIYFY